MQIPVNLSPYWLLLKNLSEQDKLSLIELLVKSLQVSSKTDKQIKKIRSNRQDDAWVTSFYGSWKDFPETAEELINLIENARTLGRPVEML